MAKKITIPSEYKENIQNNLENANTQNYTNTNNVETVLTQDAMLRYKEHIEDIVSKPKEVKRRVEERSADRGPMMNVHVPNEVKDMIEDVKRARRNRGIKVTVDTIIFECIQYWLANNYDKETK